MITLEFWPDYGLGPLWLEGTHVDPASLCLTASLVERLTAWHERYEEAKLPLDGPGDRDWLAAGAALLHDVRVQLAADYRVVVTEPWWEGNAL